MKLSKNNPIIRLTRWLVLRTSFHRFMPSLLRYGGWLFLLPNRLIGFKVLLLTTTGRKTGKQRKSLIMYLKRGQDYIIAAHKGGDDRHPSWYHNLMADPGVTVEIFWKQWPCRAEPIMDDAEAKNLLEQFPFGIAETFQEYTSRTIPIIRLTPINVVD